MIGTLRSKLALALVALVLFASAIAIPLSSSILHTHAADPVPIPFSNIQGTFYNNPNDSGSFDITPSTSSVFTQGFPATNFNPPTNMQNCSNSTGVDENTRPFTDLSPNSDGSCTTIPAQDNSGDQAGVGDLSSFETAFTATLTVPSAGQMTTNVFADDGWILSIGSDSNGDQPTPAPGNIMTNPPSGNKGPLTGYPEMGDNNVPSSPTQLTIAETFPAAGTYPIELDYTECCGGSLTLVVSNSFTPTPTPTPSPSPSPSPTPPPVVRMAPYDFTQALHGLVNCNTSNSTGTGVAHVDSDIKTGNLLVDLRARTLAGAAVGHAGVGVMYTAPQSGKIFIKADVVLAGFDLLTLVSVPKLGKTAIVSLQSSVEISVTRIHPRRDNLNTTDFAHRIITPLPSGIIPNPISLVVYNPPKTFSGSVKLVDVTAGDQLFICVGVKSKVVATGLIPLVGTAKVLYGKFKFGATNVQKIRIAYV